MTLPTVELLPVTRLFRRCARTTSCASSLFTKGSGRLLYEVLDDLFDYCFPILDKIGHKLDVIEDDVFEGRSEEVVRDISNVKQEIISYRKIIKPERPTLRVLEGHVERFLPGGARALLRRHRRRGRAHLGLARQLQGGRRGARGHERVRDLAPPERVLRILTMFSVVLLPLTLITGIFGMNVRLPRLRDARRRSGSSSAG